MKTRIGKLFLILACAMTVGACTDDDEETIVTATATGTMTDLEGNTYQWVRIGEQDWMAENLRCGTPFYDMKGMTTSGEENIVIISDRAEAQKWLKDFGNYYSYQQAQANCPDGWRLPTDEDWKQLERTLGMSVDAIDSEGWRNGAASLMQQTAGQGTGLGLRLGGELCKWGYISLTDSSVKPYRQYEAGMYWTATKDTRKDNECAYYRKIMSGRNQVERRSTTINTRYLSVRYIRESQK